MQDKTDRQLKGMGRKLESRLMNGDQAARLAIRGIRIEELRRAYARRYAS